MSGGDFFWCAGQGRLRHPDGAGSGEAAAALLLGIEPDPMVSGIDPAPYLASRFMN
jgi:D-arginine dehydrogenase